MRRIVLSLTIGLAFVGPSFAQTNPAGSITPEVLRGTSADPGAEKAPPPGAPKVVKPPAQRAAAARSAAPQQKSAADQQRTTRPQDLRASRYGGFAPAPAGPPPALDLTSPRTLNLVHYNTQEVLTVTYWSNGAYHRGALDKLNHFLRDTRDNAQTEMDPLVLDVLWHTAMAVGFAGTIEVLSAYRSPASNAWLASVSRGVARDSQHINGNAMDIRFPGVPVFRIRQAAYALNMGGVGFYPRSGFVHLDTGPVRYW
jgi:uncharacterized protein YcbK (DUF882 family)